MTAREQARKSASNALAKDYHEDPLLSWDHIDKAADASSDVWEAYMRRILDCWNDTELWDDEAADAAINVAKEALGIEIPPDA